MARPQTIQIFLPEGNPRGVKIAELTNRVVKAILVPRNKLEYMASRNELANVGLYFLFGNTLDKVKPVVYIGEAENCLKRLNEHNKDSNKDFWTHALVTISNINSFTKAHVKYLEHLAIKIAKDNNRFETENKNSPSLPYVTESMEADLLDSFDTIKVLLSTLGYPLFDSISKESVKEKELLYIKGKSFHAEGDLIDDGFVVFKGSKARKKTAASFRNTQIAMREKLINQKILVEEKDVLVFTEDFIFTSPSAASDMIKGNSSNGWIEWKDKDGKTLDELKRN